MGLYDCILCKHYTNEKICKSCIPWQEKTSFYCEGIECPICCSIKFLMYPICEICQFANFRPSLVKNRFIANLDIILEFRFGSPSTKKSLENCATIIKKLVKFEKHPEKYVLSLPLEKKQFSNISKLRLTFPEIICHFRKNLASLVFSFKFLTRKDLPLLCIEHIFDEIYPTDIF